MSGMKNDLHVKKLLPLDKPHKGNSLEPTGNFLQYPLTNTGKSERLEVIGRLCGAHQSRLTAATFLSGGAAETSSPSLPQLTCTSCYSCFSLTASDPIARARHRLGSDCWIKARESIYASASSSPPLFQMTYRQKTFRLIYLSWKPLTFPLLLVVSYSRVHR